MANEPNMSDGPSPGAEGRARAEGLRARGGRLLGLLRKNPFSNLMMLGGFGAIVFGLGIAYRWADFQQQKLTQREVSLPLALAQLDAGAIEAARETAADLRQSGELGEEGKGGPAYVLGAAMAADARLEINPRERRSLYLLSARYLEEALAAGYPAGREGHADFLLGKAHFEAGRYAASLDPLRRALESYPGHEAEIHALLATAYLRDSNPQLEEAYHHNAKFLEHSTASADAGQQALLTQAEIEYQLGRDEACRVSLDQITPQSSVLQGAMLLRGRLLLREGDALLQATEFAAGDRLEAAARKYEAARDSFLVVRQQSSGSGDLVRQSQYLLGLSHRKLGAYSEAEAQFSRTRRANYDTAEGLASGLHEAELQMMQGNLDIAIDSFTRVFRQAADLPVYSNRWIPLQELQDRAEQAFRTYFEAGDYLRAIRLAEALSLILDEETATQRQATAFRQRAETLEAEAERLQRDEAPATLADARAAWREAAALYEQLARVRYATRAYPDTLWESAQAYLKGHDYRRAARLFRSYLGNEVRRRHPPALAALGETYLALDEPSEALRILQECIQFFPKDPHTYRARLTAAKAYFEAGNRERAKQLLTDNLENEALTPRSVEWRESLYALGRIHYRDGLEAETQSRLDGIDSGDEELHRNAMKSLEKAHQSFQKTISLLNEAVQRDQLTGRDPQASETMEARYLVAESHRQSAKLPLHRLETVTIETTRNQLNSQIQRELLAAESIYQELQRSLNAKQENMQLSGAESKMLRNSYFSRADVLYDLENLEDAIQAYATATNRYQNEPEALEAYVQIANCHRLLNRESEARGTLEQAKVVLQRIRDDADFTSTTRYDREEWGVLLDWLTTL